MTTPLAFVDTETTGLDPDRNEVWEVALILRDPGSVDTEYIWHLPVDLGRADAVALTIGRFYERWSGGRRYEGTPPHPRTPSKSESDIRYVNQPIFAEVFAELTHGAHLVGAVPSFDDAFLKRLLRANGACPGWHYHLVDVEALAAGWLGHRWKGYDDSPDEVVREQAGVRRPPWNSNALSEAVGVVPEQFDRHTALGDARWAKAIYDAVMG